MRVGKDLAYTVVVKTERMFLDARIYMSFSYSKTRFSDDFPLEISKIRIYEKFAFFVTAKVLAIPNLFSHLLLSNFAEIPNCMHVGIPLSNCVWPRCQPFT